VLTEYGSVLLFYYIFDFSNHFTGDIPDSLDMLWDEQETVRIDMAMLDEAASLFRATTRIGLVHETALVVHEIVKVPASAGQTLTKVVRSHL
jgi:hypothetical protein